MTDADIPRRPERKATLRLGQRELSFISLGVIVIVVVALLYGGYRGFLVFKAQRDVVIARDNLHALYSALMFYTTDNDGKLPPADQWTDAVAAYLSAPPNKPGGKMAYLHGPGDGEDIGYVYNDLAAGYNFEPRSSFGQKSEPEPRSAIDPHRTPLLIEQAGALPNAHEILPSEDSMQGKQALYKLLQFPHNSDNPDEAKTVILFLDGHIETDIRQDFRD